MTLHTLCIIAVRGQICTEAIGSLSHHSHFVTQDQTFILAGYTFPCNGTVVAWEFCYQISDGSSVTFYPGIWRITEVIGPRTDYALVQSSTITYDPRGSGSNPNPCRSFILSAEDQFTAPAGSVVGLYSNVLTQLLHTNTDSSITTYQFSGNETSVSARNHNDVSYNISVKVHVGKC